MTMWFLWTEHRRLDSPESGGPDSIALFYTESPRYTFSYLLLPEITNEKMKVEFSSGALSVKAAEIDQTFIYTIIILLNSSI